MTSTPRHESPPSTCSAGTRPAAGGTPPLSIDSRFGINASSSRRHRRSATWAEGRNTRTTDGDDPQRRGHHLQLAALQVNRERRYFLALSKNSFHGLKPLNTT